MDSAACRHMCVRHRSIFQDVRRLPTAALGSARPGPSNSDGLMHATCTRNQPSPSHGVASVGTGTGGTDGSILLSPLDCHARRLVGIHTGALTCTSSHIVRHSAKPRVLLVTGVKSRPLAGASRDLQHRPVPRRCEHASVRASSRRLAGLQRPSIVNSPVPHDDFTGISCNHCAEHH